MNRTLLFYIFTVTVYITHAQNDNHSDQVWVIKIKTDTGTFTGRLTHISSSYVEITNKKSSVKSLFYSTDINSMSFKKSFLYNTSTGIAKGVGVGAFLVIVYYAKSYWLTAQPNHSDPSFIESLWTLSAVGAGVGFIYSSIESLFIRKRFFIYKLPYRYDEKRDKLKKYLFY